MNLLRATSVTTITGMALFTFLLRPSLAYEVPPGFNYLNIPAEGFYMGQEFTEPGFDPATFGDECPVHWVDIDYGFSISTYEVTNADYAVFLNDIQI